MAFKALILSIYGLLFAGLILWCLVEGRRWKLTGIQIDVAREEKRQQKLRGRVFAQTA